MPLIAAATTSAPILSLSPQQLGMGGIPQVIALSQLPTSGGTIPMISIQVPKTQSSPKNDVASS